MGDEEYLAGYHDGYGAGLKDAGGKISIGIPLGLFFGGVAFGGALVLAIVHLWP